MYPPLVVRTYVLPILDERIMILLASLIKVFQFLRERNDPLKSKDICNIFTLQHNLILLRFSIESHFLQIHDRYFDEQSNKERPNERHSQLPKCVVGLKRRNIEE